jgi:hypothetical protein
VTRTRGRGRDKTPCKKKYRNSFGSDSSFTISTPSNSVSSSLTSLSEDNKKYAGDDEREDDTPDVDDDIFREYQLTISQVLDDEQSEEITPRIIYVIFSMRFTRITTNYRGDNFLLIDDVIFVATLF